MPGPPEPADPTSGPVADTVVSEIRGLLAELQAGPDQPVAPDSRLGADLGIDSLVLAELLVRIEQATGVPIPDESAADLVTVGDLVRAAGGATDAPMPRADPGLSRRGRDPAGSERDGPDRGGRTPWGRLFGVYALAVFALVALVAWPIVAVLPGVARRWAVVRAAGRVLFAATGTRLEVEGADRLPRRGAYVAIANHASFLDPLVLAIVLPPPVVFTAVEGLAASPPVRRFLRRTGTYLVVPGDRSRGVAALAALTAVVREGRCLAVFPEGRRTEEVGLGRFRMGAFMIAATAQVPVVPVTIRGTRAILPVDVHLPRRAGIQVTIEEPVTTTSSGWSGAVELQSAARSALLRHLREPDLQR